MDPDLKKLALRAINYGLYVLTARSGDDYGAGGAERGIAAKAAPTDE